MIEFVKNSQKFACISFPQLVIARLKYLGLISLTVTFVAYTVIWDESTSSFTFKEDGRSANNPLISAFRIEDHLANILSVKRNRMPKAKWKPYLPEVSGRIILQRIR